MRGITNLLIFCLLMLSCGEEAEPEGTTKLNLIRQISLNIPEPSGLSYSRNKTSLYVVSDQTGKIYNIDFEGEFITSLRFEGMDVEGITVNSNDGKIWIVEERNRELVKLSATGKLIESYRINIEQNEINSGLEGVTMNPENGHFYLLNEKTPGLLIETTNTGSILKKTTLNFASDYSGIFYDEIEDILWIVSDESKTVSQCGLNGVLKKSFSIPISSAEGIIVNSLAKEILLVSDTSEKLFVFSYD